MSDWHVVRIGELGTVTTGRTPPSSRPECFGEVMPFITPSDMTGERSVEEPQRFLSEEGVDLLRKCVVKNGVAVSCIGWQMGKALLIEASSVTNQQINTVVPDRDAVDPLYLYYNLSARRDEIFRLGSGGSRTPILNKSAFSQLEVSLPPLHRQRRVAHILGTLDDKIELNRRMNRTLEAIARAIFKSWFIDFDPVHAKAEGREPVGMDPETAALFTDSFEDSPLGKIPKGWSIEPLCKVAEVVDCLHSRKPPRTNSGELLLQVYNVGQEGDLDLSDPYWIAEEDYASWTRRIELKSGDLVITKTGRVGAVAQIPPHAKAALGRNIVGIRSRPTIVTPRFLRCLLTSDWMRREIEQMTSDGTILRSLHVKAIEKLRVVLPSIAILRKFEDNSHPMLLRFEANATESSNLTASRDALLPKLLAGELPERGVEL